ncbi:hypothetical protein Z043_122825, partial [Scleropages formosus]
IFITTVDGIILGQPRAQHRLLTQAINLGEAAHPSLDVLLEHFTEVIGRASATLHHSGHSLALEEPLERKGYGKKEIEWIQLRSGQHVPQISQENSDGILGRQNRLHGAADGDESHLVVEAEETEAREETTGVAPHSSLPIKQASGKGDEDRPSSGSGHPARFCTAAFVRAGLCSSLSPVEKQEAVKNKMSIKVLPQYGLREPVC